MSDSMTPELMAELERASWTTRRAPHMERYVEIRPVLVRDWPDAHLVFMKIGNQQFQIGDALETKEEAEWSRDMLCIALDRISRDQTRT